MDIGEPMKKLTRTLDNLIVAGRDSIVTLPISDPIVEVITGWHLDNQLIHGPPRSRTRGDG